MTRTIAILLLSSLCVFAEPNERAPVDAPYNKVFDPWHACMAAEDLAKQGAPDALRTLFLAAYVRVSQPFLGGEGDMTMTTIFREVVTALGDDRFALALAAQRPEVRSAVRSFLEETNATLKKCPRTTKLLRDAPKIDWPMDKAYRNDR